MSVLYSPSTILNIVNKNSKQKLSWVDWKLKQYFYSLTKRLFWIVTMITVFHMINSDSQELSIKYIFFLDMRFAIKIRQLNFVGFISFYSMVFTLSSIHRVFYTFIIQQNIFISLSTTFLFTSFGFLCSLLLSNKNEYIFGFNPTNSSLATLPVPSFVFPISLNHHNILT